MLLEPWVPWSLCKSASLSRGTNAAAFVTALRLVFLRSPRCTKCVLLFLIGLLSTEFSDPTGAWRVEGKHFPAPRIPEASSCGCDGGGGADAGRETEGGRSARGTEASAVCWSRHTLPPVLLGTISRFYFFGTAAIFTFFTLELSCSLTPKFQLSFLSGFLGALPSASPWGLLALAPLPGHLLPLRTRAGEALPRM